MKIERWKKNASVSKIHSYDKDHECRAKCHSRHNNWNTKGLEKRLKQCEGMSKKLALRP